MDWSRFPLMVLLIFVGIVAVVAVGGIAIGLLARRSARRDAARDAAAGGDPARRAANDRVPLLWRDDQRCDRALPHVRRPCPARQARVTALPPLPFGERRRFLETLPSQNIHSRLE